MGRGKTSSRKYLPPYKTPSPCEVVWARLHFHDGSERHLQVLFCPKLHLAEAVRHDPTELLHQVKDDCFLRSCGIEPPMPDYIPGPTRDFVFSYWESGVAIYREA